MYSYGPNVLGMRQNITLGGGPDEFVQNNPQLFARGSTSRDEGYFYWALTKVEGPEGEPGKTGRTWYYQSKVGGGMTQIGGAVVDFIIVGTGLMDDLGIRIVTPYFHTNAGPFKRASDFEQQFTLLANDILVVDVHSRNYIGDKTGKAAIVSAEKALEARPDYSPLYGGF